MLCIQHIAMNPEMYEVFSNLLAGDIKERRSQNLSSLCVNLCGFQMSVVAVQHRQAIFRQVKPSRRKRFWLVRTSDKKHCSTMILYDRDRVRLWTNEGL